MLCPHQAYIVVPSGITLLDAKKKVLITYPVEQSSIYCTSVILPFTLYFPSCHKYAIKEEEIQIEKRKGDFVCSLFFLLALFCTYS